MEGKPRMGMAQRRSGARPLLIIILAITFAVAWALVSESREITDMAGRKVIVPEKINKVCTDWPPAMYLVYVMDHSLLAGVNARFTDAQRDYVSAHARSLPVVGGFFGQGQTTNIEALLGVKPDIVIAEMWGDRAVNSRSEDLLGRFGIPVAYVNIDRTHDYPNAILFLGRLLGREARARTLSDYARGVLEEVGRAVRSVPVGKRPRVYYAEGSTGLFTECDTSAHIELIALAGGTNVHHRENGKFKVKGREPISIEQVLRYDPEVILAAEPSFYQSVFKDVKWQNIKAVKTGRIYLTPRLLFNWFDRPPSVMRLLGIQWVAWRLHPEVYRINMEKEARRFYRLFLGLDIPSATMRGVIGP